jgi:folate-dependent phosphoribosylglycinamide formyltransferase PurN
MTEQNRRVVLLAGPGESTAIVYNALRREFAVAGVILERGVSRMRFVWRRIRKQSAVAVGGQLLFRALAVPVLRMAVRRRLAEIKERFGLDATPIPSAELTRVPSANSPEAIRLLRDLEPAVVVINGTGILSRDVLRCIQAPFLNLHAGITPLYRGVHGGYWALVNCDHEHCGVTVHLVDETIDTGAAVFQQPIEPSGDDNFVTYPMLQLGIGLPLLKEAIRQVLAGRLQTRPFPEGPSRLWPHPTLWHYLSHRARGIR